MHVEIELPVTQTDLDRIKVNFPHYAFDDEGNLSFLVGLQGWGEWYEKKEYYADLATFLCYEAVFNFAFNGGEDAEYEPTSSQAQMLEKIGLNVDDIIESFPSVWAKRAYTVRRNVLRIELKIVFKID